MLTHALVPSLSSLVPRCPPDSTVPDSAKLDPAPPPPPISPSATPPVAPSSGNGKRTSSGGQQQSTQQPQQRYPSREVPPRFRQQEHKQLLKRGQPLPPGSPLLAATARPCPTEPSAAEAIHSCSSSSSTASLPTGEHCDCNFHFVVHR